MSHIQDVFVIDEQSSQQQQLIRILVTGRIVDGSHRYMLLWDEHNFCKSSIYQHSCEYNG